MAQQHRQQTRGEKMRDKDYGNKRLPKRHPSRGVSMQRSLPTIS